MKKPSILLIVSTLFCAACWSQKLTDTKTIFNDSTSSQLAISSTDLPFFTSSADADKIIGSIMEAVGLDADFKVKIAHVPNVEASIRHHERYILYNPDFVNQVNKVTKDKWASIFILAHEIGHHLSGHTLSGAKSCPAIELEADQFAGFVLRKMGASLEDAQVAVHYISSAEASKTHPGREDRLEAIGKGWDKANSSLD